MNVASLIKEYFRDIGENISIDVFDAQTLNTVYSNVIQILASHFEIETSVLQSLSYCFYEILDNVHIHSGRPIGTAITHFDSENSVLRVLIADDGMGIQASLSQNDKYKSITERDALRLCLQDSVTDGKGMGFGLYATSRLMKEAGLKFIIHSGNHKMIKSGDELTVVENGLWQGTVIYMEIRTSIDMDPNDVVENRTNVEAEFNEPFLETEELDSLW